MSTLQTLMDTPLLMLIVAVGLLAGIGTWITEGRSQPNDQPNPADQMWTPADIKTDRQGEQ